MSTALLVLLAAAPPVPPLTRVGDDGTLSLAIARSELLARELLSNLPPSVRNGPRERVAVLAADIQRDRARLAQERRSPLFEAGVFYVYSELIALAAEHLGPEGLRFPSVRADAGEFRQNNGRGSALGKTGRVAYTETLFPPDELKALALRAQDFLLAVAAHDKLDPYQNAKWKQNLGRLRLDLTAAVDELGNPAQTIKVIPEAKLLGIYAKIVGLAVQMAK